MKNILILNGANLNLLGKREPNYYGNESFEEYLEKLKTSFPNVNISYFQSNIEGAIVNALQNTTADAIVLNAGGYSHTSVVIRDAIIAIEKPVVEVHISNIFAREEFRHTSLLSPVCKGVIVGLGLKGYKLAIQSLVE
ncbi:MAG: type II 3-dehydroquinate dehydratase [Bacteroidales bacterium]|nr:type II 3-dehydroquinate dehydratase [Candidatus Scybalousia scybalohippi]